MGLFDQVGGQTPTDGGDGGATAPADFQATADAAKAEQELLEEISTDFKRLQQQKSRKTGGVEARVLQSTAFDWGEHNVNQSASGIIVEPHEPNKLYLRFNLVAPAKGKLMGRLTSIGMNFHARPDKKDPQSQSDAEVVDKLILAIDEKVDQPSRSWELFDWLVKGGVAFEYVPWIPNNTIEPVPQFDDNQDLLFVDAVSQQVVTQQQRDQEIATGRPQEQFEIYEEVEATGDVGSEILGPLNVFIDQSVRSIQDLAPDQAVYIAKIRTGGWVEENFEGKLDDVKADSDLKIVTTALLQSGDATASLFLKDMIPMIQGEQGEDDPPLFVVVERFQPVSKKRPHGRYTVFIPNKIILLDGDNPYEDGDIPLVDFHFQPVTTTFWTKDYITDLIPPQKFLNKRISQLGEQANSSIYTKILLGGTLTSNDVPTDKPGVIPRAINDQGQPLVQLLPGPQLPAWFLESIDLVSKLFQQIAGGRDLFEGAPGQMRGPMALPMLQEILDSEWGMLYQHIGQRYARVKQMRVNRVKQFYPPIRTMHYTDKNERDEVISFHKEKIFRPGNNFNITVERGSLMPEMRMIREERIMQRLNSPLGILYTDDRTGKLDKSKIASDLNMGDYGREGKESQSRKFQQQIIERLWKGENVPPVMQFWNHEPMLDELESEMETTEFLAASQQIQQIFMDRWQQHSNFLQQKAQAQEQSMQSGMMRSALANATQQVAAKTAAEVTDMALQQVKAGVARSMQPPSPLDMIKTNLAFQGGPGGPPPNGPTGQNNG